MTRRLCRRLRRGVRLGVRLGGPGPPPLPPVEVNSEGPKDPRWRSKRALAGPQGPRPDLSPSGCGPRPFARIPFPPKNLPKIIQKINQKATNNLFEIHQKSTKNGPPEGPGRPLGGPGGFLGRLERNLRAKMAPRWIWEPSWGGSGRFLGPS